MVKFNTGNYGVNPEDYVNKSSEKPEIDEKVGDGKTKEAAKESFSSIEEGKPGSSKIEKKVKIEGEAKRKVPSPEASRKKMKTEIDDITAGITNMNISTQADSSKTATDKVAKRKRPTSEESRKKMKTEISDLADQFSNMSISSSSGGDPMELDDDPGDPMEVETASEDPDAMKLDDDPRDPMEVETESEDPDAMNLDDDPRDPMEVDEKQ